LVSGGSASSVWNCSLRVSLEMAGSSSLPPRRVCEHQREADGEGHAERVAAAAAAQAEYIR
jgi:hypothetical protein